MTNPIPPIMNNNANFHMHQISKADEDLKAVVQKGLKKSRGRANIFNEYLRVFDKASPEAKKDSLNDLVKMAKANEDDFKQTAKAFSHPTNKNHVLSIFFEKFRDLIGYKLDIEPLITATKNLIDGHRVGKSSDMNQNNNEIMFTPVSVNDDDNGSDINSENDEDDKMSTIEFGDEYEKMSTLNIKNYEDEKMSTPESIIEDDILGIILSEDGGTIADQERMLRQYEYGMLLGEDGGTIADQERMLQQYAENKFLKDFFGVENLDFVKRLLQEDGGSLQAQIEALDGYKAPSQPVDSPEDSDIERKRSVPPIFAPRVEPEQVELDEQSLIGDLFENLENPFEINEFFSEKSEDQISNVSQSNSLSSDDSDNISSSSISSPSTAGDQDREYIPDLQEEDYLFWSPDNDQEDNRDDDSVTSSLRDQLEYYNEENYHSRLDENFLKR